MNQREKEKAIEIEVTGLTKRGNGLGELVDGTNASVVEVPFAIPGDRVSVTLRGTRRGVRRGVLQGVLRASPSRVMPKCSHFSVCGGCRWQQLAYDKQLEQKQALISQSFSELMNPQTELLPMIPCENFWNYRNKMEFTFSNDASGNYYLGLIQDMGKGRVCDLKECHLANDWFIDALKLVRQWWIETGLKAYHMKRDSGSLRLLTLREGVRTGDRLVMLTVSGNPDYALDQQQIDSFVALIKERMTPANGGVLSIFLRIQQIAKGMPTSFYDMKLCGGEGIREQLSVKLSASKPPQKLQFQISPHAFFQPNTIQAEKLYEAAFEMIDLNRETIVYDLFCGTGTIGICASKFAKKVIGVDISPEATENARANVLLNQSDNVEIYTGAVRHLLSQIVGEAGFLKSSVVIIDPPRPGLDEVALKYIGSSQVEKILYISCNYETQAENVRDLISYGYRMVSMRAIDQFPHTRHVENVVVLVLDK